VFCSIRFVFPPTELLLFYDALTTVALAHNFQEFASTMEWKIDSKGKRSNLVIRAALSPPLSGADSESHGIDIGDNFEGFDDDEKTETLRMVREARKNTTKHRRNSIMTASIARHMDVLDFKARRERIVRKRGCYHWLPVLFANDLVHGSWWFTIGSFYIMVIQQNNRIIIKQSYDSLCIKPKCSNSVCVDCSNS